MKTRIRSHRFVTVSALLLVAFCPGLVGRAAAACFSTPAKTSFVAPRALLSAPAAALSAAVAAASAAIDDRDQSASLVGLWNSEFLLGEGPVRYDQTFQIIHADGTEMMVSNGLPPALGNVCVGIWKQIAPRTFKLKHMTWNWDANGGFAGTFLMTATLRLDRRGHSYTGTWSADSYDTEGDLIPALHAEGIAHGTRIGLD
jgi:hypothetical protein